MTQGRIGLDISDYSIELVALARSGRGISLANCARVELPEGIVRHGLIVDKDKLAEILRQLLVAAFGPKHGHLSAGVTLPDKRVYAKLFRLPPNLSASNAVQAAALEAQRVFPIPVATAVQSATVVDRQPEYQEVFFAAVDRNLANLYVAVLEEVGITPLFFDGESTAISRSLVDPDETDTVLIADIGAKASILSLYDQGRLKAGFSINAGGDSLTQALVKKLKVTTEEAEAMKRRSGLNPSTEGGRAMLVLQEPVADIITEIKRTLDYAARSLGKPVTKIVLAGGTSLVPGLQEYMALNFSGMKVVRGEPFHDINTTSQTNSADLNKVSILYATAVGLALRAAGLRVSPGLDLLPRERQKSNGSSVFDYARQFGASIANMMKKDKSEAKPRARKTRASKAKEPVVKKEEAEIKSVLEAVTEAAPMAAATVPTVMPVTAPADKPVMSPSSLPPQEQVVPIVEPVVEKKPAVVEPVAPPKPEPKPAPMPEPMPVPEVKMPEPVLPAEPEAVDYGQGVGDILEQELQTDSNAPQPTPVPANEHRDNDGHEHLSIEAIIAGKRLPKAPVKVLEPVEEEPVAEESGRPSVLPLMIAVILLVVATAAGVYFFARKTGFDITRFWPKAATTTTTPAVTNSATPTTTPTTKNEVPTSVSVEVTLGITDRPAAAKPFVKTRIIETDVNTSGNFRATGVGMGVGGKSAGQITITNTTNRAFTFVATTRFLTKDGVLFRMNKTSAIPASGSVTVAVTADKAGPTGDIGPSDFTIPGLSADLQPLITGKSDAAMSGGSAQQAVVTADDLAKAKNVLFEKLKAEAMDNFKSMASKDEVVAPDLVTSTEVSVDAPAAGAAQATFDLKLSLHFKALVVPETQLRDLLREKLTAALPAGAKVADYEIGTPQYSVAAYDTAADVAEIRAEAPITKI